MSDTFDFNDAESSSGFDLIPAGTIVPVIMTLHPGGTGEGGWLKKSASSDALMLDCEWTVLEGPYARRRMWGVMVVSGGRTNENGESIAAGITRGMLRSILESSRGISPNDHGEAAQAARRIKGWQDFNGISFLAKIGIEKDKSGRYEDRNRIQGAIVPGMRDYHRVGGTSPAPVPAPHPAQAPAAPAQQSAPTSNTSGIPVPAWAR